jgi:hypothetical protein
MPPATDIRFRLVELQYPETLEQNIITPQRHSAKDPALMPAEH